MMWATAWGQSIVGLRLANKYVILEFDQSYWKGADALWDLTRNHFENSQAPSHGWNYLAQFNLAAT